MKFNGAQVLIKMIKAEGIDTIFGYPGGCVIDIYDELAKQEGLRHILVRHEQGAVHAADGYARANRSVGVALVTSGPGATNAVTGIASAHSDSIPIVVFTGQVPTALIGNDAFQEVDIVGITRPCTKHNYLVKSIDKLASTIKEAFYLARSGRPGPVLVDLPKNILQAQIDFEEPGKISLKSYKPNYKPNKKQLNKVVEMIKKAKRPVIFAGGGVIVSQASEQITRLAKMADIPVTASLMGLGAFPGSDPLWLGMLGMHGTYRANMSIGHCDLMIAAGVRFDDRVTGNIEKFAPTAKIVQIDIDPTSIHKNIEVHCPIVGDCKAALEGILHLMEDQKTDDLKNNRPQWLDQIEEWKSTTPLKYNQGSEVIKPQFVVEKLYELTKGDAIITTEVGQNQMWAAQYYHFNKPNHFITSGGLGTMGFGLPAAIGAKAACPDKLVVDVAGDGSIQMNIQELMTAVESKIDVKIVILNNQYLGMVRQWQELFYEKVYSFTNMENTPDFVKLAEAYGAKGLRCTRPDEVESVLSQGLNHEGTVIMEFAVDKEESVYPMVPAGGSITEMLLV
ncbi:MAG: biosynthetic-type acetolactate synthase large subunit [Desulfobacula sp.]|jgi:acetolactate synthase-1/2/3 large subunit|uniref:biosynthetic-type acetolactate synthase large subunit n=1 Tax=Desulfobacula sp. TaxID=2593537 RepID=UPI001D55FBA7|nr:biosynthetic-type acetolactate synthase large subunit [Desulfobacula sp.]MBT3487268.1 biosynthetic-type acetolactate synthase large subunit [Desulfobacula sp.]MBT3806368.1 biosynthetic-type acetolactate synthase large subunit [Desulfobacula sp.]MBT4025915.1 biosynthetic-type acetolactate synthase large subunit [Desulfobacula sp.]MBT4200914.1 biosynthetic-type acetolactate synthase large subunit [Desulfobacula sp.]